MSSTFSIYPGQVIEATRRADIFSVLQGLPTNTQKLIKPRDVRDAFLTVFSSSSFKITRTSGNQEYIGLDSGNPIDRDIKKKILIGKRSVGSLDIMTDSIINNTDADILFYNTKLDNQNQDSTKVSFIAGTNPSLYTNAPYIQSLKIGNSLSFNIINEQQQGSINIQSNTGRVSINGINFPTISENQNNVLDGKFLRYSGIYPFGKLEWSDASFTTAQIGSSGSQTDIYGDPVLLNGNSLEFVDDRDVPVDIGGINQGSSFSAGSFAGNNWPLSEITRLLLYPYIPPFLTLDITTQNGNKFAEVGSNTSLTLNYSMTAYSRDSNEYISSSFLRTNGTSSVGSWSIIGNIGGQVISPPGSTFTFSQNTTTISNNLIGQVEEFGFMVSNINDPGILSILNPTNSTFGYSHSVIDTVTFIGPYMFAFSNTFTGSLSLGFYSFTPNAIRDLIGSGSINKIVEPFGGTSSVISVVFQNNTGQTPGYIYFMYPSNYPELTRIKDINGFTIYDPTISQSSGTFTYSIVTPATPFNYYGNYRVYRIVSPVSLPTSYDLEFTF
jgi:hypothetical protein